MSSLKDGLVRLFRWLKILIFDANTVVYFVELGGPKAPFTGAELLTPSRYGAVELRYKNGKLYQDGKEIELFLTEEQKKGCVHGSLLYSDLTNLRRGNISARVLDFLIGHPELWPEEAKNAGPNGERIYLYFWGDIFCDQSGENWCVRYGCYENGKIISGFEWLSSAWKPNHPAAVLSEAT